ncbi:hypothetical protein IV203_034515 [Nitzschia inconspicua]|uniref:Uncharacterized protein n=1 Tax=Nitzschia inconspicua TaxID=303405 RepID=A0A9K3LC78_9STRA|nr:hypothetical protein IV203_002689 [Nitzschia inconspicua]KAG7339518.1 hypothetical protein IV203_002571 [Nitzschia inconspicua]KAG7359417.1 hypothetical protein IV203_034515 [Nitzschia inconspicua]
MTSQRDSLISIASHIVRGDYDRTIALLTEYLTTLRAEVVKRMGEESTMKVAPSLEDPFEVRFAISSMTASPVTFDSPNSQKEGCQGRIPIFGQPLVVRCDLGVTVPPETLSFVAMYNLALAYQLKYSHEEIRDISNLRKAADLYKCSQEVVLNQSVELSAIHLFTLLTNLASAQEAMWGKEEGRLCLGHALPIYMLMVHSGDEKELPQAIRRFLRSVLPLLLPDPEIASAA